MHRFLYVARPRADLTDAEFQRRWQQHAQLAATCPEVLAEVRGYRQWTVVAPGTDGVVGVAETRCADAAAVYRMLECAGTREVLQPDELRFLDAPCRATGLVADATTLHAMPAADAVLDHGCLWLAPRLPVASTAPTAVEVRAALLHRLFAAAVASFDGSHPTAGTAQPHELSLGWRDPADDASPFAALLFARFAAGAAAAAVAAAWRAALLPGENVWLLQRAVRHPMKLESIP